MSDIYTITRKKSVKKDLKKIPKRVFDHSKKIILDLANNPLPVSATQLKGYHNTYRIRIGNYRIIYQVDNKKRIIDILKIGHRKDIYRKLA